MSKQRTFITIISNEYLLIHSLLFLATKQKISLNWKSESHAAAMAAMVIMESCKAKMKLMVRLCVNLYAPAAR